MIFRKQLRSYFVIAILILLIAGSLYFFLAVYPHSQRGQTVFVYGTLMNPLYRTYACVCLTPLAPATLPGYTKVGRNIVENETGSVAGGLIRVTRAELARLDRYERVPYQYQRSTITIDSSTVFVYIAQ